MKKALPIVLGLIFSFQISHGQINGSTATGIKNNTHDYYFLKHKQQKKNGLIFLGVGTAFIATGIITYIVLGNIDSDEVGGFLIGAGITLIGGASLLVSVPILISSGSNKRKAKAFIASENIGFNVMPSLNTRYVSLGLSINL